ncbi:MAG: hypothetical protein C7B45_14015 [Sulfobacillus acidophilus]|uniref:Uncharacterized protein n=1 Tax=Sulfobacillus acidophilus TaxID=53633 RepID=A0A2T2WEH0_9FIRM|nr:MAG: hypothetical protein C7B45_14015 [Sulfobacillus acidophilus]
MKALFIINDPPYGTERVYNALRHANAVSKAPDVTVKVFLMADAVHSGRRGQKVPHGYYNVEHMLTIAVRHQAEVGACGSCMDARGLTDEDLIPGIHRSSMEELTAWTLWADQVIVY